jgi:hypothetical protein
MSSAGQLRPFAASALGSGLRRTEGPDVFAWFRCFGYHCVTTGCPRHSIGGPRYGPSGRRFVCQFRSATSDLIDRAHRNGDPVWDGDQTLWRAEVCEGDDEALINFVVPRGDGFIEAQEVVNRIRRFSLDELRKTARRPAPDRQPQVPLIDSDD